MSKHSSACRGFNQLALSRRSMLRVGDGTEQPGVDLVTPWYRRNFLICANSH